MNPKPHSYKQTLVAAAVLVAAGALVYMNSFTAPFLFDGVVAIRDNPNIRSLWPIWDTVSAAPGVTVAGRPVLAVSLAVNYQISGLQVWSYHLFNLIFHVLAALLLYGIIRRTLLAPALKGRFDASAFHLALAAALLWLVHPLHTNAVTYINQRAESLMGMFYLLTIYCSARAFSADKPRNWIILSLVSCALAMGTKEAAATIPLVLLLYDRVFFSGSFKAIFHRRWWLYAGLFTLVAAILSITLLIGARSASGFNFILTPYTYAATQCNVIVGIYLKLAFWPHPLIFDYGWPLVEHLSDYALSGAILLLLLAATAWALRYRPPIGFLGACFFIILAPTSSIMPITTQIAVEYRMYLPLAAIIILTVLAAHYLLSYLFVRVRVHVRVRDRLLLSIGTLICLMATVPLAILTHQRNHDYKNPVSLWTGAIEKSPENKRALQNRGTIYGETGKHDKAIRDFNQVIKLAPDDPEPYNNRGTSYYFKNQHSKAVSDFEKALALGLKESRVYLNLGMARLAMRNPTEAIKTLNEAIRLSPENAEAYNYRGMAYGITGSHARAIKDFNQAIKISPDYAEAYANRGAAYVNKGNFGKAISDMKKSAALQPQDPRSNLNLARTLAHQNRHAEAITYYRRVLKLTPKNARLNNDLALILATHPDPKLRNGQEAIKLAKLACRLTHNQIPTPLSTLAAAYAETGNFPQAIKTAQKALEIAQASEDKRIIEDLEWQIELYRKNTPLRLPKPKPHNP